MCTEPTTTPREHRFLLTGAARVAGVTTTFLMVVIGVAVLATAALVLAGYRPSTDRSNSMAPSIHRGDVLFSRPILASQVRIGEVITFPDPYFKSVLLTHRVRAERLLGNGRIAFTTRGDANKGSEFWTIAANGRLTRLAFRVPDVGKLFIAVDGHPLYLVIVVVLLLWLIVLRLIWGGRGKGDRGPRVQSQSRSERRSVEAPSRRLLRHGHHLSALAVAAMLTAVPAAAAAVGYVAANTNAPPGPTVTLIVNDQGHPLFDLVSMRAGEVDSACELVTNQGPALANVGIYGTADGSGLQQYLNLTVTRGTLPLDAPAGSCSGFAADATDYRGDGAGVIYRGPMTGFPGSPDAVLMDPQTDWPAGDSVAYEMTVSLADNNAAQGLNAAAQFFFGANAGSAGSGGSTGSGGGASGTGGGTASSTTSAGSGGSGNSSGTQGSGNSGGGVGSSLGGLGSIADSASPNGNLIMTFTTNGKGSVSATAYLVSTTKVKVHVRTKSGSKVKMKVKTKRTRLGSGQIVATRAGSTKLVIKPSAGALRLYRKSPRKYRISVILTYSPTIGRPYTTSMWVSARSLGIIAKGPHHATKKR